MKPIEHEQAMHAIYAAGHWLFMSDRVEEAIDLFRTMMLAAPTDVRGWLGLGACHEARGEEEKAIELYRLASAATGPRARLEMALARIHRRLGERTEMESAYARAEELVDTCDEGDLLPIIRDERSAA
jgi:Flp pilus assembly protein TadD